MPTPRKRVVAIAILANLAFTVVLIGDEPKPSSQPSAKDDVAAADRKSSDKAVVKDVVYCLEEENGNLVLTSQPLNGVDRTIKRTELSFEIPKEARVVELALEKLDGKNLTAVVKLEQAGKFQYHCFTFIAPWGGHVRDSFQFHEAMFYSTSDDLKILALSGKYANGSVFIVLGTISTPSNTFETVTQGVFYLSTCPWPPSDGVLTPFHAKSAPPLPTK